MREITIIFKQAEPTGFSATIQEMPEIEVVADTLKDAQAQIFSMVQLVMSKCFGERSYKVNIMLHLSIPKA